MQTRRQRFIETMTFGNPDIPASGDYFFYDSTHLRWEPEGLPVNADMKEYFNMDFDHTSWKIPSPEILPIILDFGTTVIEDTDTYKVIRQPDGEVVKILKNSPLPAAAMVALSSAQKSIIRPIFNQ